jgi:hypothetical protein
VRKIILVYILWLDVAVELEEGKELIEESSYLSMKGETASKGKDETGGESRERVKPRSERVKPGSEGYTPISTPNSALQNFAIQEPRRLRTDMVTNIIKVSLS